LNSTQLIYIAAGLLLPLYYVPQIRRCLADRTLLASYSMGKSGPQLMLRIAMMPFVFSVGDMTMSVIVSLDLLGRLAEMWAAVWSLRRQGQGWIAIARRSIPWRSRRADAMETICGEDAARTTGPVSG